MFYECVLHKTPINLFTLILSCMHSFNKDVSDYQISGTRLVAEDKKMKNSEV